MTWDVGRDTWGEARWGKRRWRTSVMAHGERRVELKLKCAEVVDGRGLGGVR